MIHHGDAEHAEKTCKEDWRKLAVAGGCERNRVSRAALRHLRHDLPRLLQRLRPPPPPAPGHGSDRLRDRIATLLLPPPAVEENRRPAADTRAEPLADRRVRVRRTGRVEGVGVARIIPRLLGTPVRRHRLGRRQDDRRRAARRVGGRRNRQAFPPHPLLHGRPLRLPAGRGHEHRPGGVLPHGAGGPYLRDVDESPLGRQLRRRPAPPDAVVRDRGAPADRRCPARPRNVHTPTACSSACLWPATWATDSSSSSSTRRGTTRTWGSARFRWRVLRGWRSSSSRRGHVQRAKQVFRRDSRCDAAPPLAECRWRNERAVRGRVRCFSIAPGVIPRGALRPEGSPVGETIPTPEIPRSALG